MLCIKLSFTLRCSDVPWSSLHLYHQYYIGSEKKKNKVSVSGHIVCWRIKETETLNKVLNAAVHLSTIMYPSSAVSAYIYNVDNLSSDLLQTLRHCGDHSPPTA